ncbi:MAG TPA: type II secretion system protein [Dehalococcoidia bacterium]|jgi:prepilin-type N-terminal cleavage/methylation domain-containing protein
MNKYRKWLSFPGLRSFRKGEQGLTLIEVLIALSIIAVVATTYLVGMQMSTKAVITTQEHVNAESLAKSQMEAVKRADYDETSIPPDYQASKLAPADIPAEYDIVIAAVRLEADPLNDEDDGLQQITVTVTRSGRAIFTLEGYKCFMGP